MNAYICIYVSWINNYISYDDMLCYVNVTFYKTVLQFYNCQFVYCAFCRSVTVYPFILEIYILMHYANWTSQLLQLSSQYRALQDSALEGGMLAEIYRYLSVETIHIHILNRFKKNMWRVYVTSVPRPVTLVAPLGWVCL